MNEIYLNTWAQGILDFTPSDSLILLGIAEQNIASGGNGVVGARVMLDIQIEDNSSISNARITQGSNSIIEEAKVIKVYPNPAKDYLTLELTSIYENQSLVFELYNTIGLLVYSKIINGNSEIVNISLKEVPSGCYNFKIKNSNKIIANDKIVILK
jgi:hypothetical protein